ncbi:MAG TPA: DUF4214 domain-containing protein [Pyrinomonadaceae bacterium]|nr:DUF4214 domain-containing protein [Pyrinomonadaceae bacterium]
MFSHPNAQRYTLHLVVTVTICISFLPLSDISWLVRVAAQGQGAGRGPRPRPGKPEATLPDLEDAQSELQIEREPVAPIPSTMRSKKNSGKPWDGRRVGDPFDQPPGQSSVGEIRRAHARRRMHPPPPPVLDDQFVQNFFTWALARNPASNETTYWYDQFRVASGQGQTSLKSAGIELGRTLFESAEYAARNRSDHWYVYDLYKTYLMRDPDSTGWANWEATVPTYGREYVRRGFEESSEFATLSANITPNGSATAHAASLVSARIDPRNQPGHGMLARDASWSVPLLSLPGRNGLDLGLTLSYSSMVWTHSGPYLYFDEDNGFPSLGFRLGFPTVQLKVFDAQTARNAYLMITAAGQRVELRQVGTSNIYDVADSSYLRLTDNGSTLVVQSTDGTKLSFVYVNDEYRCNEVKDRNGNYLTINYNSLGQITTITDTLGRVITFNYDTNANLTSITQSWNGQSHQWVSFGWSTRTMQSSFSGAAVVGTSNGTVLPVITQVGLNDTSYFTFDYTNSLQVSLVKKYFGVVERNATTFTYETPGSDVPRLTDSRVSAQNWTGINGVPAQVITQYSVAGDGACVLTAPDGTVYKEYYGTGWQRGLTTLSEVWSGGVRQKWTTTTWTQDNTAVGYEVNPRVTETNIYDASGNRRRSSTVYTSYNLPAPVALPTEVKEYAADGTTVLRRTTTTYFDGGHAYIDLRVLGLLREVIVYDGNNQPQSKVWYDYDWGNEYWAATPQAATQHDASGVAIGRGNLCWIGRWDVTDVNNFDKVTHSYIKYNKTGSVIATQDHYGHGNTISYTDSFSDSVNRNTFAYPTTVTDADGFSSSMQYNFDLGATTRTQSPAPAGQSQGAIQTMSYNSLGQLERITTANNGAYKRFIYGSYYTQSFATVNNIADELYSIEVVDGLGRVIGTAGNHPDSTGGYRSVMSIYDQMGRLWKQSNPTEINVDWVPVGDDAAGFYYTQQTYDWKGRPLITTNTDGTTREASYAGCGCAGGEVVTLTDEGTIDAGVAKRRQQKIYSDVLGRTAKTEILNWQGGSVYSTTVNSYDARDQVTQIRQYAGAEGSGTYQDTILTYDGYGRLKTKHVPEHAPGTAVTWNYNADDTVATVTDARGATSTFTYNNNRHLPNVVTHTLSGSSTIVESFGYDAVGNRTSMSDSSGSTSYYYNQLSQLTSETRTFTGLAGSYALAYEYNYAGQLKDLTDHTNQRVNYGYDSAGRLSSLNGTNYSSNQFIITHSYSAWGVPKQVTYGDGQTLTMNYNSRLQPTHYQIGGSGSVMSIDYQYYDDGRVKYSQNLVDGRFDRKYEYDHSARLIKALTGAEARGEPATSDRPYKQTIAYDAFDHVTTRTTRHWSRTLGFGSSDTYTNNRRNGWTYDADGNLLNPSTRQYSYDAAGRSNTTTWTGGYLNEFFDGDGQRVKSTEPNIVNYYVRSTVLRGQVITQLDSSGAREWGFIYVAGELFGRQYLNGGVTLLHKEPSGVSERAVFQSGVITDWTELDPFGAEVYAWDPYPEDPQFSGGREEGGPVYPGYGNVGLPSTGCTLDGVYVTCDMAQRILEMGAAVSAPEDTVRYNYTKKTFEFFRAFADGYSGYLPADAQYSGGGWAWSNSTAATAAANGSMDELAGVVSLEPQNSSPQTPCHIMADIAQAVADDAIRASNNSAHAALTAFDQNFSFLYHGPRLNSLANMRAAAPGTGRALPDDQGRYIGGQGFQPQYQDSAPALPPPNQDLQGPTADQTHHFSAHLSLGINRRPFTNFYRNITDNDGDSRLGFAAYAIGRKLRGEADRGSVNGLRIIGEYIRRNICTGSAGRGLEPGDWAVIRRTLL